MSDWTFRLLVVKAGKQTRCFREAAITLMKEEIAGLALPKEDETDEHAAFRTDAHTRLSKKVTLLVSKGQWREVWLRDPQAIHDEQISALCLVADEETGRRYDPTKEAAARCKVMVEKWNGFPEAPSMEAYRKLELEVSRLLDAEIYEWMYPSGISSSFSRR